MRAAIVEREVSALDAREHDSPAPDAQELHLIHVELVGCGDVDLAGGRRDRLLDPPARVRVAVVHADLVAVDQRSAETVARVFLELFGGTANT